jgi:MFS family permease
LFVIFLRVEKRTSAPLLELSLFKNKWFTISVLCSYISFLAIFCSNIVMPFYLQDVLSFSPGKAGMFLSIYPLILALVAPISGYLSDKIGSEVLTLCGLSLISLGLFLMSTLTAEPNLVVMGVYVAIMSLGNGLFQSPNTSLVMSTLPKNKLGIGGGVNAFVRNFGMISGITLATTLLYSGMSAKLGEKVKDYVPGREDSFIFGMHLVYITAGIICLIGALITALRLFSRRRESLNKI